MTFETITWKQYGGTPPQKGFVRIYVDTAADLPTTAAIAAAGNVDPLPGSRCIVCDSGQEYILDSTGNWNRVQGEIYSNVYTQTQIDNMLSAIGSQITAMQQDILDISPGFFQLGTVIEDNTDLNTLTVPGVYISTSGSKTGTLINCPVSSSPFRLEVKYTALTTRYIQTLQAGATNIYTRNKYTDTTPQVTGWNHWYRFSGTDTGS